MEIETLVQNNKREDKASDTSSPTTYSNVYIRIQPYYNTYDEDSSEEESEEETDEDEKLQFLILLHDPEHKLTHTSITQGVSSEWIELWDKYTWVEDLVADSLRLGVEVLGQEYVVSRMGWAKKDDKEDEEQDNTDNKESKEKKPESS